MRIKFFLMVLGLFANYSKGWGQISFDKKGIDSLRSITKSSQDKWFNFFYENQDGIDSTIGIKGYSRGFVDYIICKEEIDTHLWDSSGNGLSGNPDWNLMTKNISTKYSEDYSTRIVLGAQVRWYSYKKDTSELLKYFVRNIDKFGLDTAGFGKAFTNNTIYYGIFIHSWNKTYLNDAIKWMFVIVKGEPMDAEFIDTYANLLYKVGKRRKAIAWETKATKLDSRAVDIRSNLKKMEEGEPTWPLQ